MVQHLPKKFFEVQHSTTQTSHQLLAYLFMTSKGIETRATFLKIANDTVAANTSREAKRRNQPSKIS